MHWVYQLCILLVASHTEPLYMCAQPATEFVHTDSFTTAYVNQNKAFIILLRK